MGVGCMPYRGPRNMYQSVHLESRLVETERRTPELSVVRIPITLVGTTLPLPQLHCPQGAKGLRSRGDSSPQACEPPPPLPDYSLVIQIFISCSEAPN